MKERYLVLVQCVLVFFGSMLAAYWLARLQEATQDRWRFAGKKDGDGAPVPFETSSFDDAVIKARNTRNDQIEAIVMNHFEP